MNEKRRVVLTGIGPITAIGFGRQEFWKSILDGKVVVEKVPDNIVEHYKFRTKHYVPFPEFSLDNYPPLPKFKRLMENAARIAVVGTELALIDAGIKEAGNLRVNPDWIKSAGILLGIGNGTLNSAFNSYAQHTYGDVLQKHAGEIIRPEYNRFVIPATMPDSTTSWISILFGIHGANQTINTSCSSGSYAIGEAFRKIKDGYSDIMITGGVECMKDQSMATMRGFDTLGTLTSAEDGRPMPFSEKRSGFLFSEGACCILILEELEQAKKRGAEIVAEIVNYQANSDAFNIVQMQESGEQIIKLLRETIGANKIDYLNTHGTATEINDRVERTIINEVFGEKAAQPLINSTKSILGHSIGASGALEAAVTALSLKNAKVHANLAEDPFEDLNLALETTDAELEYALSTSYGFGGHNAAILFKRYTDE